MSTLKKELNDGQAHIVKRLVTLSSADEELQALQVKVAWLEGWGARTRSRAFRELDWLRSAAFFMMGMGTASLVAILFKSQ